MLALAGGRFGILRIAVAAPSCTIRMEGEDAARRMAIEDRVTHGHVIEFRC